MEGKKYSRLDLSIFPILNSDGEFFETMVLTTLVINFISCQSFFWGDNFYIRIFYNNNPIVSLKFTVHNTRMIILLVLQLQIGILELLIVDIPILLLFGIPNGGSFISTVISPYDEIRRTTTPCRDRMES